MRAAEDASILDRAQRLAMQKPAGGLNMVTAGKPPFPTGHGSVTFTTRRGRPVSIRHIRPDDDALLVDLFHNLSPETRRLRFFSPLPDLPDKVVWREAKRLSDINPLQAAALVGTAYDGGREQAIGVARLVVDEADAHSAEIAIVVRDDYQSEGVGTVLLDLLTQVALVRGLKRLHALSLLENVAVRRLFERLGLPSSSTSSQGETTTVISLRE
jgi:acetyltransferase